MKNVSLKNDNYKKNGDWNEAERKYISIRLKITQKALKFVQIIFSNWNEAKIKWNKI